MEHDIQQRLELLEKKVDAIFVSVEKTRKYFLWTLISSAVFLLLPLLALVFVVPFVLDSYMSALSF